MYNSGKEDMSSTLDAYRRIYRDGSRLGRRQFNRAGIACAGLKRSLGFVIQPVENWSRYPELNAVLDLLTKIAPGEQVLDLGSPKMLGLLLAQRHAADFCLTDLWDLAVDEVRELVRCNRDHLAGKIDLRQADLTNLTEHADRQYDRVYSVSVIEHIEDLGAVRKGLNEMARVLKPGGGLVVSVPVAPTYRADYIPQPVYGDEETGDDIFFSHYFDREHLADLVSAAPDLKLVSLDYSRWNTASRRLALWRRVPQKIRGLLGWVNLQLAPSAATVTREAWADLIVDRDGDVIMYFERP